MQIQTNEQIVGSPKSFLNFGGSNNCRTGLQTIQPRQSAFGPKDVEIRKIAYKALCCDRFKVTSQLLSLHSQNLSLLQSLFSGFGKIKKGSWSFLKKLVVQPLLRQLLLPSTGERQLYFLAAALKFPKVENNKRFLFAVYFQNKARYPTVKYFYTQQLLFLISTSFLTS